MDNSFFLILFLGLGAFYLAVGLWSSSKTNSSEEFFLAGRSLGLWSLTLTLLATQIGGGALMGTADKSFNIGFYGIFYNLGMCLGFVLLGLGFASKLRAFNVGTVAEIFETVYHSPNLKKIASVVSALSLFGLAIGQVVAIKLLLGGLGITSFWAIFVFWTFIIIYTMLGGLRAVVIVDMVQVIVIILALVVVFGESFRQLSADYNFSQMTKLFIFNTDSHLFKTQHIDTFALFLMPMMFSLVEQDLAQRFFAAKTQRQAIISCLIAALVILLFSVIPVHFGIKAKLLGYAVTPGQSSLVASLKVMLSPVGLSFLVCAIASAIVSSADSLICAVSSNICLDFHIRSRKMSSFVTMIVGFMALFVGIYFDDILVVLVKSYELTVSTLFVPIFMAFFIRSRSHYPATCAFCVGAFSFTLFHLISTPFSPDLLSVGSAFLAFVICHLLLRDS